VTSIALLAAALSLAQLDQDKLSRHLVHSLPGMNIGPVRAELLVAPTRKIESCRLINFSGRKRVGDRLCRAISRVDAKDPASSEGKAVYGVVELQLGMTFGENARERIERMNPSHAGDVRVVTLIDVNGRLSKCGAAEGDATDQYVWACEQAEQQSFLIRRDKRGHPVPYVASAPVRS
jgi:hypothetical protein